MLSGALCSKMKENIRIKKYIWNLDCLMILCTVYGSKFCASSRWDKASGKTASWNGAVSRSRTPVGPTPSFTRAHTSLDIKRLCRSEVTKEPQVTETWTTIWARIYLILGSLRVPLSQSCGRNTFVSVSQGSASLFSWCVFVLAAHTGCAHSFFAVLTALLQFPANSNRERQKIKVWIVWAWFIKELWGLKIRVRSSQNVRKYREECWDFCFSQTFVLNLAIWKSEWNLFAYFVLKKLFTIWIPEDRMC